MSFDTRENRQLGQGTAKPKDLVGVQERAGGEESLNVNLAPNRGESGEMSSARNVVAGSSNAGRQSLVAEVCT